MAVRRVGQERYDYYVVRGKDQYNVAAIRRQQPSDGWVTRVAANIGGHNGPVTGQVCLWAGDGDILFRGEQTRFSDGRNWRHAVPDKPIRRAAGSYAYIGFWMDPDTEREWWLYSVGGQHWSDVYTFQEQAPGRFEPNARYDEDIAAFYEYVPNEPPLVGAWRTAPEGTVRDNSPLFEGFFRHAAGDREFDTSPVFQVIIRRADTGGVVLNRAFNATDEEQRKGYFSRDDLIAATPGLRYYYQFRHQDSWGEWSPWTPPQSFAFSTGPRKPTANAPTGKINTLSGFNYTGSYSHTNGLPSTHIQVEVYDATGKTRYYYSGIKPLTIADGVNFSYPSSNVHGTLYPANSLQWRVAFRDGNGVWSPWSDLRPFRTNALPYKPSQLSPANEQGDPRGVLACAVADPDGDRITAVRCELVRAATETAGTAAVGTNPKSMIVASSGASASLNVGAQLTLGVRYQYRAQAFDGTAWGPWSDWAFFVYQQVPQVSLLTPSLSGARNGVPQPSAEISVPDGFWTDLGIDENNTVARVNDGDASSRDFAWEAVSGGSEAFRRESAFVPVDATRFYVFYVHLKKKSTETASSTHFRVACYDASSTLLGRVYPDTYAAANGADVPNYWKRYGGGVAPAGRAGMPAFPSGTTQAKIELCPSADGAPATVRFDDFFYDALPWVPDDAQWAEASRWFGYFDGAHTGYGPPEENEYRWEGDADAAPSSGLNVLTSLPASLLISYSSSQNVPKASDRVLVERWDGKNAWAQVHDSGYVAGGARTTIPVASGVLKNQGRYRIKVHVKDANGVVGETPFVAVDAELIGPPELDILLASGDDSEAYVNLQFEPSALGLTEFGGIEIGVQPEGEPATIVARLNNPNAASFFWPYPVSGDNTTYLVRQVMLVDGDEVQSRWTRAQVQVNYYPYFFLRDARDPLYAYAKWRPMSRALPSRKPNTEVETLKPWGVAKPVHLFAEEDYESGGATIQVHDDPGVSLSPDQVYRNLRTILKERPLCGYLSHHPAAATFVDVTDGDYAIDEATYENVVSIQWEEAEYPASASERGEA